MAYFRCGGGLPTQTKSTTATTSQQIVTPDSGYVLESVTVNPQSHSSYYPSASSYYDVTGSETINLGNNHNYRYIRVNGQTYHSDTYTPSANTSNNNMGTYHTYKYVDTSGMIIPSGTITPTTRSSSINCSSKAYVNTMSVPSIVETTTLWTNSSPSSSMAKQRILMTKPSSVSGCNTYARITYRISTSNSATKSILIPMNNITGSAASNSAMACSICVYDSSYPYSRALTGTGITSSSKYEVEVCDCFKASEIVATNNSLAIPTKIEAVYMVGTVVS